MVGTDRKLYAKSWKKISREIRERAKNADGISQCECMGECGLHRTTGGPRRCVELHRHPAKWARGIVTLTTAHLCHTPCIEGNAGNGKRVNCGYWNAEQIAQETKRPEQKRS